MSIYKEIRTKLDFEVSGSDHPINFKVDCQNGTRSKVSFKNNEKKTVGCGEVKNIGNSIELKGKTIIFNGFSSNPSGSQIKIIHTITEENGNELIYSFPDDYTGEPDFDNEDQQPSYKFYINFI